MTKKAAAILEIHNRNPKLTQRRIALSVGCTQQNVALVLAGNEPENIYKCRHFTGSLPVMCGLSRCYAVCSRRIQTHQHISHTVYLLSLHAFRKACVAVSIGRATPQQWNLFNEAQAIHQKLKSKA